MTHSKGPSKGRSGYRKPNAKRQKYSWSTTLTQQDRIRLHRFEGEDLQPCLNRLLRRLAIAIENNSAPPEPAALNEPNEAVYSLRPEPIVAALIEQRLQKEEGRGRVQRALFSLVNWALELPVTGQLASAEEAMGVLRQFRGQRLKAEDVKDLLTNQCTDAQARSWLWELHSAGKIRLVTSPSKGIQIGSKNNYYYIDFF
jgi:hypothetical protein